MLYLRARDARKWRNGELEWGKDRFSESMVKLDPFSSSWFLGRGSIIEQSPHPSFR